jgi:hypothetical protein
MGRISPPGLPRVPCDALFPGRNDYQDVAARASISGLLRCPMQFIAALDPA